ncbi:peptidoglycan-binding domain-containing protein [Streptomyces sp. NPDC052000]|uniref:peptidoglycan-binding domain-containing protein n=1 Tax=Streptomyces sp. NPDC052000 TaxID=3155676 RepID=UPI00344C02E3
MSVRRRLTTVLSTAVLCGAAITAATGTASAATGASYISQGQNGFQVYCVQVGINWSTWSNAYVSNVDGSFGPDTLNQVQQLQRDAGLNPDGVVGPDTGDRLWQSLQVAISKNGNINTKYGVPLGNCYQVLPTHA